jgi:hypothetical protein
LKGEQAGDGSSEMAGMRSIEPCTAGTRWRDERMGQGIARRTVEQCPNDILINLHFWAKPTRIRSEPTRLSA